MVPPTLWILRLVWLVLPLLTGPAFTAALADRSHRVQVVASVLGWALWGFALVCTLVPRTVSLTAVRLVVPGAVVAAAWATAAGDEVPWGLAGLVAGLVAVVLLALPVTTDAFVDGSSYGEERRVALATPPALLIGPLPLAWAAAAAGVVTGPLLLAAGQWVVGSIATGAGAALAAAVAVRVHVLSRRWLVFVPAGVVVHDPLALVEPVLVPRHLLRRIGPATAESDATDLTGGALGLVLEIRPAEPIEIGRRRGRQTVETTGVVALLVSPGRPAAVLEIATGKRLPVS